MKRLFPILAVLIVALNAFCQGNPNPNPTTTAKSREFLRAGTAAQMRGILELSGAATDAVPRAGTNMTGGLTNNVRFFGRFVGDGSALTNLPSTHTNWIAATNIYFNVKSYGALGDNSTDDRVAMQAAIDAAELAGGTVFMPGGIFRVSFPGLNVAANNVRLLGSGMGTTIIKWLDGAYADDGPVIYATGTNLTFESFTIHGNKVGRGLTGSADYEGLNVANFGQLTVLNVEALDCAGDGFDIEAGRRVAMANCRALNAGGVGFSFQVDDATLVNLWASNCAIFTGVGDVDNAAMQFTQSENVSVSGSTFVNNRRNFYSTSSTISVSGCNFLFGGLGGLTSGRLTNVWLNGGQGTFTGCVFSQYQPGGGPNLQIEGNSDNGWNITGNFFRGTDGPTIIRNNPSAVLFNGNVASGDACVIVTNSPRTSITANRLRGSSTGIYLSPNTRDVLVDGNSLYGGNYAFYADANSTNVIFSNNKIEDNKTVYIAGAERWQIIQNHAPGTAEFGYTGSRGFFHGNYIGNYGLGGGSLTNLYIGNMFGNMALGANPNGQKWRDNFLTNMVEAVFTDEVGVVTNHGLTIITVSQNEDVGLVTHTVKSPGFYRVSGMVRVSSNPIDSSASGVRVSYYDGADNRNHYIASIPGDLEMDAVTFYVSEGQISVVAENTFDTDLGLEFEVNVTIEKLGGGP